MKRISATTLFLLLGSIAYTNAQYGLVTGPMGVPLPTATVSINNGVGGIPTAVGSA